MSELAEEMEMMVTNLDGLNEIADSLDSFNEAFASYLYVMKMNTLCVEWPEVWCFPYSNCHRSILMRSSSYLL